MGGSLNAHDLDHSQTHQFSTFGVRFFGCFLAQSLHTRSEDPGMTYDQWLLLVPLKGGRWHTIPQLAVYTTYIPLIYCLLGDYMIPTTYYQNQNNPMIWWINQPTFLENRFATLRSPPGHPLFFGNRLVSKWATKTKKRLVVLYKGWNPTQLYKDYNKPL